MKMELLIEHVGIQVNAVGVNLVINSLLQLSVLVVVSLQQMSMLKQQDKKVSCHFFIKYFPPRQNSKSKRK